MDCAIGKLMGVSAEETHFTTSMLEFNRKATLLRWLLRRGAHPKKSELIGFINTMQNESKRNVFAHSYVVSDENSVTYIERSRGRDYKVVRHTFTFDDMMKHTNNFHEAAWGFFKAFGFSHTELDEFVDAAFKAQNKA